MPGGGGEPRQDRTTAECPASSSPQSVTVAYNECNATPRPLDDALATGAARWAHAPGVEQVVLCTPDKDLAQCVRGRRVVMLDRRRRRVLDEAAVIEKFGVPPGAIADWLALVGDAADGIPGIPRWGAKTVSAVLSR